MENKFPVICHVCHHKSSTGPAIFFKKDGKQFKFCSLDCYHEYKERIKDPEHDLLQQPEEKDNAEDK